MARSRRHGLLNLLLAGLARLSGNGRTAALLILVLSAGAAALLPRFRIEPDFSAMLPKDHPALAALTDPEIGGKASRTLFVLLQVEDLPERIPGWAEELRASPLLSEVSATREDLVTERLAEAPWTALLSASDAQLAELERRLSSPGREQALQEAVSLARADPVAGRRLLTEDPFGIRWVLELAAPEAGLPELDPQSPFLLHRDGRSALIRVVGHSDPFDLDASRAIMALLESTLAAGQPQFLGGYAVAREESQRIRQDLERSLMWSVPCLLLYLIWATRSLLLPHLIILPVLLSLLWTLGYGSALLGPLTPLAVSGAVILLGLCVDFPIHYAAASRSGRGALRVNLSTGRVILYSMLTSAAAFLSFGWGSFTGLRSFGILLAIGLALGVLATFLVLPPLLRRWRGRRPAPRARAALLLRFARTRGGLPAALVLTTLAAAGWAGLAAGSVGFTADPAAMRPDDSPVQQAASAVQQTFGFSPVGVQALVPAAVPLADLRALTDGLLEDERVILASGPQEGVAGAARIERLRAFSRATAGWREGAIAELRADGVKPELVEPALANLERALQWDAPHSPEPWHWQGQAYWPVTFLISSRGATQRDRLELRARMLERLPQDTILVDPEGFGDELERYLEADLLRAMLLAGGAVVLMAWLALRSWRTGALALIPVAIGMGVVLALLSWSGVQLSPASFIALPLILGLGVDYGLHVVALQQDRGRLESTAGAIRDTTCTTLIGFGSLVTSASPGIAALGGIVAAGVLVCYLASMIVLPRLLFRHAGPVSHPDSRRRAEGGA